MCKFARLDLGYLRAHGDSNRLTAWDSGHGADMQASVQVHQPLLGLGGQVHCIAAHASTEAVALGCGDNTIRILSLAPATSAVSPPFRSILSCSVMCHNSLVSMHGNYNRESIWQ